MSYTNALNRSLIDQWIAEKLDPSKVSDELQRMGFDEESIKSHLKQFKKIKYEKKQYAGFICLGIGAFIGFISCLLALINPIPDLYYWFLYGITSIAMLFIFFGLYKIFE